MIGRSRIAMIRTMRRVWMDRRTAAVGVSCLRMVAPRPVQAVAR